MSRSSMPEDPTLLVVIAGLVVAYVLHRIHLAVRARARVAELNRRADVKRQEVAERLEAAKAAGLTWEGCCEWATANPRSTSKIAPADVIRMSATQLLNAMNTDKKLSSEYVMRCFVGRAIATHVRLNAVTEQDYIAAVADAAECDAERSRGHMRGRLHGLPISIKEHICMAGFDATCGAKARLQQPADKDAVLVSVLKTAGAIPFARTNVPQLLLVPESCNEIYGDTNNPYDQARSSGGSSGGESALIAGLGSPLGVGTDVGGSIRIPATVTGICGLKPSYERLSYAGVQLPRKGGRNGQKEIRSIIGPMARTVEDLELFMDVCCAAENGMYERDQTMPRGAWDHAAYAGVSPDATSGARSSRRRSSSSSAASGRKLRFGYFKSDGWFEPAPACARAVDEAVKALEAAGHEVVPFTPDEMVASVDTYIKIMASDGKMRAFVDALDGEPMHPTYAFLYSVANLPNALRPVVAWVLRHALGDWRRAMLIRAGSSKSTHEYWQAITERDALRERFIGRFVDAGLDALICPGLGLPAFPHYMATHLNMACSYTFAWNNFNLPAGSLPVTTVAPEEQYYESDVQDKFTRQAQKAIKGSAGLPVGVQVVSLPWRDELCLGAMRALEVALDQRGTKRPVPPD